mmetsp:Transcript_14442/g.19790  ORF Transcript_14442/g.19790 Transcript_14442/m.19790 type:complete len:274 (-) Transcript_14442:283-1104(-)
MHTPPPRLLGTCGMSSPKNHRMELVALFREEPVPTTSPTYAKGKPRCFSCSNWLTGPTLPSTSGTTPSRAFFNMASACSGMSGRDQASGAGDRSSVLVSPPTLNTVTVILAGTSLREVNHSASAQDCSTCLAKALPALALASTSKNASNIRIVCFRPCAASGPSVLSSNSPTSVAMLYPPCMVPSNSVALSRDRMGLEASFLATALRNAALTYAASSTPGEMRFASKSFKNAASAPFGSPLNVLNKCTRFAVVSASRGLGTTPIAFRSATTPS